MSTTAPSESKREKPPEALGFIGLGLMGEPMVRNLLAAGLAVHVHNRSRAAVDRLVEGGAVDGGSPRALGEKLSGGLVLLSLTNSPAVLEVCRGEQGLLHSIGAGTVVVDLGTTGLEETRELAAQCEALGARWVDAPVSGGQVGAEAGNLTIMAGGKVEDFDRVRPILRLLGDRISHLGPVGCGQVTKLANQVIVALTIDAVAEALVLAQAAGVEPGKVRDAIRGGFAESRILELQGGKMVEGDFEPGGRATGQLKDVREACRLAEEMDLHLPGLERNLAIWQDLVESGFGERDHSVLFERFRRGDSGSTTNG